MPTPPRSAESKLSIKARIEAKLREGCRPPGTTGQGLGAVRAAAAEAVDDGEFHSIPAYLSAAYSLAGTEYEPDWTLYSAARYNIPRPVLSVSHPAPVEPALVSPAGQPRRILVIGDLHQDPREEHRLQVLTWLARYASSEGFERIIQIGDWSTWDSVSTHDRPDTMAARYKPTVKDDLANLTASHQAFRRGLADGYAPKLDFLTGNHEHRLERWENTHPESYGIFTLGRDETFAQFGWKVRPYGQPHYVEGVAFAHHATSGAGRAFGGETGPQRGANKSTVSFVGGHTHRAQLHNAAKIGPLEVISFIEVGCAMPWGEVEHYLGHGTPSGWYWGVCAMTVQGGLITDVEFKSMLSIRSQFSDDGADVRAA